MIMEKQKFDRFIESVKHGNCPPTVGHRITEEQHTEIKKYLDRRDPMKDNWYELCVRTKLEPQMKVFMLEGNLVKLSAKQMRSIGFSLAGKRPPEFPPIMRIPLPPEPMSFNEKGDLPTVSTMMILEFKYDELEEDWILKL